MEEGYVKADETYDLSKTYSVTKEETTNKLLESIDKETDETASACDRTSLNAGDLKYPAPVVLAKPDKAETGF